MIQTLKPLGCFLVLLFVCIGSAAHGAEDQITAQPNVAKGVPDKRLPGMTCWFVIYNDRFRSGYTCVSDNRNVLYPEGDRLYPHLSDLKKALDEAGSTNVPFHGGYPITPPAGWKIRDLTDDEIKQLFRPSTGSP